MPNSPATCCNRSALAPIRCLGFCGSCHKYGGASGLPVTTRRSHLPAATASAGSTVSPSSNDQPPTRRKSMATLSTQIRNKKKPDQKVGLFISQATGLDQLLELGDGFEQVSHQAIIGHLEDRRFFVLVDRNDHFGVFHAGQVLEIGRASCRERGEISVV